MKILFQGDSITDAGRDRSDPHELGHGYPLYAAKHISEKYPDQEFEFIDLGISGNRAENLVERWQRDAIDIQPDIISILIGVNDTWHRAEEKNWMPHDYFEACYRVILTQLKERTNAKIIMMEQFLAYTPDKAFFRYDLDPKIQVTRKLAREFADAYIPLDGIIAEASIHQPPTHWAADGVHPTAEGSDFIGKVYCDYASPLIDELIRNK